MKTLISFRLRNVLDADLIAIEIEDEKLPDLCRDGLRLMLGIRTAKALEIKEKQISLPPPTQTKEKTAHILQGKPAVFVPKKNI